MHVLSRCTPRPAAGRVALLVVAGAVVLAAAGCAHDPTGARADDQGTQAGIGAAPGPADPTAPVQVNQTEPGSTDSTGRGTGSTGGASGGSRRTPRPSTSASAKATAPVIVYFRIQQQPKCKGSSGQGPVVPLIVEWKVTGADTVVLSTGGAGKTYPGSGTETYVFGCAGAAGSTESHKYTLTADHDGVYATKSLTASAGVNKAAEAG